MHWVILMLGKSGVRVVRAYIQAMEDGSREGGGHAKGRI